MIMKLSVMCHVFCMVCLLIILTEPLGLLFLVPMKNVENFKVPLLSRTSSTMPDEGKSKLILVVDFESHKTLTRQ